MFCKNCNEQIADNSVVCPHCQAQLSGNGEQIQQSQPVDQAYTYEAAPAAQPQPVASAPVNNQQPAYDPGYTQPYAQPVPDYDPQMFAPAEEKPADKKNNSKEKDSRFAKGYAAIASVLIAFPAFFCLVIDYVGAPDFIQNLLPDLDWIQTGDIMWSAYLVGFFMCAWMVLVLPALRPKHPALVICICLGVVSVYMLLLSYVNHSAGWYVEFVLPISLMVIISSAIMTILISYKIIRNGHVVTAVGAQIMALIIAMEIIFDYNLTSSVKLGWSLITAAIVCGALLLYEAIYYATRLRKK